MFYTQYQNQNRKTITCQSNTTTFEMKSETRSPKLFALSKLQMWTRVQTACAISLSECQYILSYKPKFSSVQSMNNFLCSALRLLKKLQVNPINKQIKVTDNTSVNIPSNFCPQLYFKLNIKSSPTNHCKKPKPTCFTNIANDEIKNLL